MLRYKLLLIGLLVVGCEELLKKEDVRGCTVETACNFNADANIFDNSCVYEDVVCSCDDAGECYLETDILTTYIYYDTPDCSGEGEEVSMTDNHLLIFNSNGTLNYDYGSGIEGQDFTWEQSENYITTTMNGLPWFTFTLLGNTLTTTQNNNGGCEQMVYTK